MATKEEILSNHDMDIHYYGDSKKDVLIAMEEYTRQEINSFEKWKFLKDWRISADGGMYFQPSESTDWITFDQLYDLYLQSKNE